MGPETAKRESIASFDRAKRHRFAMRRITPASARQARGPQQLCRADSASAFARAASPMFTFGQTLVKGRSLVTGTIYREPASHYQSVRECV
jgi:hypothetical protein